jgi:hypothetical protein
MTGPPDVWGRPCPSFAENRQPPVAAEDRQQDCMLRREHVGQVPSRAHCPNLRFSAEDKIDNGITVT